MASPNTNATSSIWSRNISRLTLIDPASAPTEQRALFDALQSKHGTIPALYRVYANSPSAFGAILALESAAEGSSLSPLTRERIALALAQLSSCGYCLNAHTNAGRALGLTGNEMLANRGGTSEDARAAVAVGLATTLARHVGTINGDELKPARQAGYSDGELVEIILQVGLNLLDNILAKAADLENDPTDAPQGTQATRSANRS